MIQLYLSFIFLVMPSWIVLKGSLSASLAFSQLFSYWVNGKLPKVRELSWLKHEMHLTDGGMQGFAKIRYGLGYQQSRKLSQEGHLFLKKKS